jgi:hypothetical protein
MSEDFKQAIVKAQREIARASGHAGAEGPAVPDWPFITYGDPIQIQAAPYIVKGVVTRGEFSCWFGKPKGGKSFVMLDLALHVAAGRMWRGRRVRPGRVLYLPVEAGRGFVNRLAAAKSKFGPNPLPLHVVPVPLNLLNGDADRLLAFIQAKVGDLSRFDLIVLDTLSRAAPGGNENGPETMTALIGVLDRIRAATGAHVAVVHHTGKDGDRGMRGHSSLLGAVDLAVEISEGVIRVDACREGPGGDAWRFAIEVVELGIDEDGDPITSCIIREIEGTPEPKAEKKPRPLGAVEKVVLDCLNAALADHGKAAEAAGAVARDIPRRAIVVSRDRFDAATDRYLPDKPANKRREAVGRALISLKSRHLIKHVDGWLWRPLEVSHDVA